MNRQIEHFVVDTNTLINLNGFSKKVFPSLWANFHEMVDNGQIISVTEVQGELSNSHGPVKNYWDNIDKKLDNNFFWELYDKEVKYLSQLEDFEEFQKAGESNTYFADPHLIAMAMSRGFIVLTDERRVNSPKSILMYVNRLM